ncbi:hypothetical protein AMTRI_Chr12g235740 [Amborella trichopoda]
MKNPFFKTLDPFFSFWKKERKCVPRPPRNHACVRTRVTPGPTRIRVGCAAERFELTKERCKVWLTTWGWGRMHPGEVGLLHYGALKCSRKVPRPLFGSVWNRSLHDLWLDYAHSYGLGCMNPWICL